VTFYQKPKRLHCGHFYAIQKDIIYHSMPFAAVVAVPSFLGALMLAAVIVGVTLDPLLIGLKVHFGTLYPS
jgi:hypothetical protein